MYTVVADVPAKTIKRRFSLEVAERVNALAWWGWKHERLRAALSDFRNLNIMERLDKYGN